MRKILLFVIVCISLAGFAFAEDKPIKFTETQKKTLEAMIIGAQVAQGRLIDFKNYLVAEYKVDQSYKILEDLSGFEKIPQPKQEPKEEIKK